jgi:hypothetical protein
VTRVSKIRDRKINEKPAGMTIPAGFSHSFAAPVGFCRRRCGCLLWPFESAIGRSQAIGAFTTRIAMNIGISSRARFSAAARGPG